MATIELEDVELREAARGQRAFAQLTLADAARQENPGIRAQFERSARYHIELAAKFERARKSGISQ